MDREVIIRDLGIEDWSTEEKDEVIENINEVTEMRMAQLVDELMTDEQRQDFERLEDEDIDTVGAWLRENIPGVAEMYISTAQDYITELRVKFAGINARVDQSSIEQAKHQSEL